MIIRIIQVVGGLTIAYNEFLQSFTNRLAGYPQIIKLSLSLSAIMLLLIFSYISQIKKFFILFI